MDFDTSDYLDQLRFDEDILSSFAHDAQREYDQHHKMVQTRSAEPSNVQQLSSEAVNADYNNAQGAAGSSRAPRKLKVEKARIVENFGRNLVDVAKELRVSKSTLKRYCRIYGIERWPSHKRNSGTTNSNEFHHKYTVTVKAAYGKRKVKFDIDSDIAIEDLHRKLGERFSLEVGSFRIEYEDDDGDQITIPCTDDLREHMDQLQLFGKKSMDLLVS